MATINEITYDVLETVKSSRIVDDSNITTDLVKYLLHVQRSVWLNRRLTKPGYDVTEDMIQDLGCLELEASDPADCCAVTTECSVLRTKKELPTPIHMNHTMAITHVGPVNKIQKPFSYVDYRRAIWSGNGRFNKDHIFGFWLNGRIYLKFNSSNRVAKMLEYINARGVFEDPEEVKEFTHCSGEPCYTDDDRYPVPENLIPHMKDQVIKQLLMNERMPEDQKNDANDQPSDRNNIPQGVQNNSEG